jgi:hypothetical protein
MRTPLLQGMAIEALLGAPARTIPAETYLLGYLER